jgi:hypothetical protein
MILRSKKNYEACESIALTSSCVCKWFEGVGFPILVESTENRKDDPIHALDIHKHDHGPGSPPHLDKGSLDGIGGTQLPPQVLGKLEKREQDWQILLQTFQTS